MSNNYSLRTTRDQRPCFVCGKLSSSVLDAPDDFFFICLSHTKDSSFCTIESSGPVKFVKNKAGEEEIATLKKEISKFQNKKKIAEPEKEKDSTTQQEEKMPNDSNSKPASEKELLNFKKFINFKDLSCI